MSYFSNLFFCGPEYCERYAKREHIVNDPTDGSDEELSDEDFSDGRSDSDDDVAGHADP